MADESRRRDRATQIIRSAKFIGDFRVLDPDSEEFFQAAMDKYDGNDSNKVFVDIDSVPSHLRYSMLKESENLLEYGLITNYMDLGNSVIVTLSTQGKKYFEDKRAAFISHRTVDSKVADMIKDFLISTGVPNDKVFCSSLPGNDVNEKIAPEVKRRIVESAVNILILSKDYYMSAYCLNEAGIAWYLDGEAAVIPIGLPEVNPKNMIGFLNSDYKLRRLDDENDISYIYDTIKDHISAKDVKYSVVTQESKKLRERYASYIHSRDMESAKTEVHEDDVLCGLSFDAAVLLLYASEEGQIMHVKSLDAEEVDSGQYNFINEQSAEEIARWVGALEELEENEYIEDTGYKREVFRVTRDGFAKIKQIKLIRPDIDIKENPDKYLQE